MDLSDPEIGRFGLPVVLPNAEQTETITGIVKSMDQALAEMKECAAGGDLLRLLHASHRLQETNSWLASHVDKVMDCRS
jgi:hypothetical protein